MIYTIDNKRTIWRHS